MGGWLDYVNFLMNGGVCEEAHIIDRATGAVWASSKGIQQLPIWQKKIQVDDTNFQTLNVDERAILFHALQNNGVPDPNSAGLHFNGVKFYSVHYDKETLVWYLKKDQGGACIVQTNKCVLVGIFNSGINQQDGKTPQNAGSCNKRVEDLGVMLKNAGW